MTKQIWTRWRNKVPACIKGKNHSWKAEETGICVKCGYDVFDECYKEVDKL